MTAAAAASTTAASKAATATTTAASAAETPFRFGAGFIDVQGSPVQRVPVEGCNRLIGFPLVGHLDKRKTARTSRVPIRHDSGAIDCAVALKQTAQRLFGSMEVQVTYEDVLHTILLTLKAGSSEREQKRTTLGYTRPEKLSNAF